MKKLLLASAIVLGLCASAKAQVGVPFTVGAGTYLLMWGSGTSGAPYVTSQVIVDPTTPTTGAHVTSNGLDIDISHWMGAGGSPSALGFSIQGFSGMTAVQVSQPTASNLNATVVNGGTFPVQAAGAINVGPTNCSGTITTGGTAQNAFAAQTTLHGFTIMNIDATTGSGEPLWISFTGTAAAAATASYPLSAPAATSYSSASSYTSPPGFGSNHALSIIGATTGHQYSCVWW